MARGVVLSDFNIENFAGYLSQDPALPAVDVHAAPFGQVTQVLMDAGHACWEPRPDVAVVWTQPHAVSEAFNRLVNSQDASLDQILEEVDTFARLVRGLTGRVSCIIVPTWVVPPHQRGSSLLEMKPDTGISAVLARMNLRLAEQVASASGVHVLNAERWIEAAGPRAWNPKLWYMAKVPFGPEVFQAATRHIKAALNAVRGQSKKLIIVDLDDTLWSGVVGEVGWEQLTLGGHDPSGEAFVDFQKALKALTRQGMLLGIVSKNDEAVALEAISKHPEMVLRQEDFAGWRINWQDKAQNVAELVEELNLGLQSVVFLDDHPAEQARVREALPEVLVPEWPGDPLLFVKTLNGLGCFETATVSQEDRRRTQSYVTERQRTSLKAQVGSLDDWLRTLHLTATFGPISGDNLVRATQLLNKTNQMNLSTRRLTESELFLWASHPQRTLWTVSVTDRFGPSGLTGLISVELNGSSASIVDFVLSCRVMGRKVEEAMLAIAVRHAQSMGLKKLTARYLPTPKNAPCLEFWARSGFDQDGSTHIFEWDARKEYPVPPQITVECPQTDNGRTSVPRSPQVAVGGGIA